MAESKNDWVATVLVESKDSFGKTDNDMRKKEIVEILNKIEKEIEKRTKGDGVILFPGGYLNSGRRKANSIFESTSKYLRKRLNKLDRKIIICIGIDGRLGKDPAQDSPKDQIAMAVSKDGIIAIGRKFYPVGYEKEQIQVAESYQSLEHGKPRIFSLNGRRFFLAVCYDVFGVQEDLNNPGVNIILNTIHQFTLKCKCGKKRGYCKCGAASGDVDFARKGLAGASKQWDCEIFGSVTFLALQGKWSGYKREIPERWPSGVYWNKGNKNIKEWRYVDNPIKPIREFNLSIEEGRALIRIYNLEVM